MEMALKKNMFNEYRKVWSGTVCKEFSADCVVPDTMPDAETVIDTDGTLVMRSREVGDNRIMLAASLNAFVLYSVDSGKTMRRLSITIPVDISIDAPGVESECRSVCRMRIRAIDARLVNSRKLSIHADVETEVLCYGKHSMEILDDVSGGNVHLLKKSADITQISDIREKTFVITDGYALPVGIKSSDTILLQKTEVFPEDAKYVSGKVVFHGRVRSMLLLGNQEGERAESVTYETEFSQIMEAEGDGDVLPDIRLALTGIYFDLSDTGEEQCRLSAEIHMMAQCVCYQKVNVPYIADLYSNRAVLVPDITVIDICPQTEQIRMRQTVTGKAEPDLSGTDILYVAASIGAVSCAENSVKTSVNMRIVCKNHDGELVISRCRLNAEFSLDIPQGAEITSVSVSMADVFCSAGGSGIDLRAVLQLQALCIQIQQIRCVSGVSEDSEALASAGVCPSVIMVRAPQEADLWVLAKKHHSTVEAIQSANGNRGDGLLIIPKMR